MLALSLDTHSSPGNLAYDFISTLQNVLAQSSAAQISVVANRALSGPDTPAIPDMAAITGPLLVLPQEHPAAQVRLIDIDVAAERDIDALAGRLVGEITAATPRGEAAVQLRNGGWFVERFDTLPLGEAQRSAGHELLSRGPHIITGGLGRIGSALARHLASLGADVVVTTRNARPDTSQHLADAGPGRVTCVQIDLLDRAAVAAFIDGVATEHGRIGGIFHAAGLARLVALADTTEPTLSAELAPKVAGTRNLDAALTALAAKTGIEPAFVMAFSSLASILGGLGMAGYAAANAMMDAIVAQPRSTSTRWITVRWDDWDFDYGDQQATAWTHTRAGLSMTVDEGLASIEAILGEPGLSDVCVSVTPLEARLARWVNRPPAARGRGTLAVLPEPGVDHTPSLESTVHAAYARVLGVADIGLDDDFFARGGDSLHATEIVLDLAAVPAAMQLRITDVFDYPTVRRLSHHLAALQHQAQKAGSISSGDL